MKKMTLKMEYEKQLLVYFYQSLLFSNMYLYLISFQNNNKKNIFYNMILFLSSSCSRAHGNVHENSMVHCRQYFVPQGLKKFKNCLNKQIIFIGA